MKIDDIEVADRHVVHVGLQNVVINTRFGLMCVNRFSPIGRSLCHYGEHAYLEMRRCAEFVGPGSVVVDIGAHQGTHTLFFAELVGPAGCVLAFEPQRIMFQNLVASVALNSIQNVYAWGEGVGSRDEFFRIKQYDYGKRGHFSGMRLDRDNTGERVQVRRLDSVFEALDQLPKVDLIKIDVEGMEADVVAGARRVIADNRPVIYCEYHDEPTPIPAVRRTKETLEALDYKMFKHKPSGYNPDNFFGLKEDRFQGGYDENAICIHKDELEHYEGSIEDLSEI